MHFDPRVEKTEAPNSTTEQQQLLPRPCGREALFCQAERDQSVWSLIIKGSKEEIAMLEYVAFGFRFQNNHDLCE